MNVRTCLLALFHLIFDIYLSYLHFIFSAEPYSILKNSSVTPRFGSWSNLYISLLEIEIESILSLLHTGHLEIVEMAFINEIAGN